MTLMIRFPLSFVPGPASFPINHEWKYSERSRQGQLLQKKNKTTTKCYFVCLCFFCCLLVPFSPPPTSTSYALLWFMVAIHLLIASITSSLLGDHGSSCVLWEGFGCPTPQADLICFTLYLLSFNFEHTFSFQFQPLSKQKLSQTH